MPRSVPYGTTNARVRVRRTGTSNSIEDLHVQYNDPVFYPAGPRKLPTLFRWGNVDEAGSTSESFEVFAPPWTTSGPVLSSANAPWTIVLSDTTTNNHVYFAPAPANLSDQRLVTPPLFLGAGGIGFTFKHAYTFEVGNGGGGPAYYDGGVVEITTDGGANWTDLGSSITSGGYGGLLSASNPLGARMAYVGTSAGYPALVPVTVDGRSMTSPSTGSGTTRSGRWCRIRAHAPRWRSTTDRNRPSCRSRYRAPIPAPGARPSASPFPSAPA
jgi:hypothetical protein